MEVESELEHSGLHQLLPLRDDDGHWLGGSSVDVPGFVGRRIRGVPMKLQVAVRDEVVSRFDTAVLPEMTVGPRTGADAVRLLDERHPALDGRVRRWVLDQALANPFALLELPSQAGDAGLPRRLHQLYGARIVALSDPVPASSGTRRGSRAGDRHRGHRPGHADHDHAGSAGVR
ncbi:hypothetical protein [Nonomuraea composti]|uniref:hypothetical protein n=1 Tax=Nonomuraea composti TaxID=2720023 RepID=UPI001F102031|nr:hypothetical protein [Nonomuraea sp. FMUSA5-5]